MKICYINPTFLVRRPIAGLIGRLGRQNDVAIFIPKKPFSGIEAKWHDDKSVREAKVYSYSAVNIPFINFEWPIPITPMFFINLFRVFWSYDIIHMWTYFYINSLFTVIFKLFAGKTRLIMTSDTFPGYSFNPGSLVTLLFKIYTPLLGWLLFSVPDKVQIYGKSIKKHARKVGVKEEKIVILPTGLDTNKFKNPKPADRKQLGFSGKDIVILYAGLIVPRKGIDTMLKMTRRLAKRQKDVKLLLVGEGPAKQEFKDLAESLGIKEQVIFTGWRKDIPNIMKMADVLILPSRGEGLPGIVMEAMASGLPVVASNIPCTNDLVQDKETGYLCLMDDVPCFVEKIKALAKNESLRKKLGKKGRERIRAYDWDRLLKRYKEELYA